MLRAGDVFALRVDGGPSEDELEEFVVALKVNTTLLSLDLEGALLAVSAHPN